MTEDSDPRYQTIARIAQLTGQLIWLGNKRFAQLLTTYGLTAPQYFTLVSLAYQDRARSMHALAQLSHQDAATVTGIVDRLEKLGFVSRARSQDDRRKVFVTLQEEGRQVVEEIRKAIHRNWQRSFSTLSQGELDEILRMLMAVLQAWEATLEPALGAE
jgi:DNA-binding MarR family transcriptional regulator